MSPTHGGQATTTIPDRTEEGPPLREDWGLTSRQVFWMLLALLGAIAALGVPAGVVRLSGQNGWMATLLPVPIALIPIALWRALDRRLPGLTFTEHARAVLGPVAGSILAVCPVLLSSSHLVGATRIVSDLVQSNALPRTPTIAVTLLLITPALYAVRSGVEVVGRLAEILVPVGLTAVALILLFTLGDSHPANLLPVLADGWRPVLQGAIVPLGYYIETFYIMYLLPFRGRPVRAMVTASVAALVGAALLLTVTTALLTMDFGPLVQSLAVPVLGAARTVSLARIVTHLDPLLIVAWVAITIIKIETLLFVLCISLSQLLGLHDYRPLTLPLGAFAAFAANAWWGSDVQLKSWFTYDWPFWAVSLALVPPLIVWVVAALRGVRDDTREQDRRPHPATPAAETA